MSSFDCLESEGNGLAIAYQTKTDAVYAYLREAIITGKIKPGERIGQEELAESLRVSATPVREAMHKLDAQGILRLTPHHGAQVVVPTYKLIDEIYQVRAALEVFAVRHAVEAISEERINCLDQLANQTLPMLIRRCAEQGDYTPYRAANFQFHRTIYASGNRSIVPELIENLWARSAAPDALFQSDIERVDDAVREHQELVTILRQRDVVRAEAVLAAHNDRTRAAYLRILEGAGYVRDVPTRAQA
ncbi:MAG: GntR family transcriptional regulator [Anaerolineales bacterium]|nr:GntR family transcriptional regulator [Anaerolineales bacterium]